MIKLKKELEKLFNDKTSGSNELLIRLINLLLDNFEAIDSPNALSVLIAERLGEFQTIVSFSEKISELKSTDELKIFLTSHLQSDSIAIDKIYENSKTTLSRYRHFITISNSRTLFKLFVKIKEAGLSFDVAICESRPCCEGVIMAENLADSNIPIKLITEAQIASQIKKSDCVIMGADKILKDGSIVNKIGSLTLAICAKYYNIPCYVVADKSKFSQSSVFAPKEHSASEIYSGDKNLISVTNTYFEVIDKTYITNLFTN